MVENVYLCDVRGVGFCLSLYPVSRDRGGTPVKLSRTSGEPHAERHGAACSGRRLWDCRRSRTWLGGQTALLTRSEGQRVIHGN